MEWRMRVVVEVDCEAFDPPPVGPGADEVLTEAFLVEEDGRASSRRVHRIATQYAPGGNYTVGRDFSLPGPSDAVETLRFTVPVDEADGVRRRVQWEDGVRRAWLDGPFPD